MLVDRAALRRAWEFALEAAHDGPAILRERVVRTAYSHEGRFMERREPFWALRNQIPAQRLFRRPPARAHGYDEYGLDADGVVLTRIARLSDGAMAKAWVTPPADESVIAYFAPANGAPGERLAAVGVYRSEAGRLISTEWCSELEYDGLTEKLWQERYSYDKQGRLTKLEATEGPDPWQDAETWDSRWVDYHFRL